MIRNRVAILTLLTALNFINYLDRYIVAAVLEPMSRELALSSSQGGLVATVFLLGYFVTSPMFGALGDRMSRKRLITFGVLVWSVATIASGLTTDFTTLVIARAFVGIGEASYATLAPTIIDDITPPEKKGKTLAIFFLAVPLGSALGYLLGGFIQAHWGWRTAFFVGGGPGVVLAFTVLMIDEPMRKLHTAKAALAATAMKLLRIPLYRRAVLGYAAHTGAIGAFSHWAPTFLVRRFSGVALSDEMLRAATAAANFKFGTVTVVAGAIGTIIGGRMTDRVLAKLPPVPADAPHDARANLVAANAQLWICAVGVAIAAPFAAAAFVAPSQLLFFTFAGIAEIGLFMSTAPINAIMLRTAPAYLRASAMAVGIFTIHLLGDLWTPTVLGVLLDHVAPTFAMMLLPLGFAIATYVWWPRPREAAVGSE